MHLVFNTRNVVYWHCPARIKALPMDKVVYSHSRDAPHPTAHDPNPVSATAGEIEVAIGFTSGEVLVRQMTAKTGLIYRSGKSASNVPVTSVRWVPGEDLFLVAHTDGSVLVYDQTRKGVRRPS
jgi:hypothetical protein